MTESTEPGPVPAPEPWPAALNRPRIPLLSFNPLCLSQWHQDAAAHTGHPMVIAFCGVEFLASPISFQAYVTYDTSHLSREERANLAKELFDEVAPAHTRHPVRLEVTFLGPVGSSSSSSADGVEPSATVNGWQQQEDLVHRREYISACIDHYRSVRTFQTNYQNWSSRMVRSYRSEGMDGYAGFLITVPVPDWKEKGALGLLYFDYQRTKKRKRGIDEREKTHADGAPDPRYLWPTAKYANMMKEEPEVFIKKRLEELRDKIPGVVWKRKKETKEEEDMDDWLWMYHQIEGKWFTERWREVYPTLGKTKKNRKSRQTSQSVPLSDQAPSEHPETAQSSA
ncbi:uncharacterized protein BKCO1_340005 [Diplodia corticola]|uniref:Uncharacterized protein n=1 Tax=Diplodia corticola TaxID=236234 RepID=A0A1J9RK69_9PEZI|nr:uncharacterized protein BKCO1_340005 [Diplodia corticola]OJD32971.1 hypothetical protein BKCO1_340005 [Diplodia corticola]